MSLSPIPFALGRIFVLDLSTVSCEAFKPLVGEAFQVTFAGSRLPLELVSAVSFETHAAKGLPRIPFCLTFRGPKTPVMPQRIYQFEHEKLGSIDVFAVPVGPDSTGMMYEVQFS